LRSEFCQNLRQVLCRYAEFKQNRRATGLTFAAGTFAMKFGGGVAGIAMMQVLKIQGYVGKDAAVQSAQALNGIRLINSFVPVIFIVLAILIIFLYPLTTEKMKEVESELKTRKEKEDRE
jgi:GPH family glycoside/pentoside/hexuronide:cation symporter